MKDTKNNWLIFFKRNGLLIILLFLLAFPLFFQLGKAPLRMWDESRLAINAYEMYHDGDILVTHYGGEPDMWNTKPPLMIWMQVLSMKIFGVNEFAVRFPSALAGLFLLALLMTFFARFFTQRLIFTIMAFILISSQGFVGHHVTRTGDYDSLLILFTTLFTLCYFFFLETNRRRYLYMTFLFLTLAVLTKSIVGLIFLPGLFFFTLISGKLRQVLTNRHFYFGLLAFLGIILLYYLLRENRTPGFLEAVLSNELGGRYLQVKESHHHKFLFYYYDLYTQFASWLIFVPAGMFIGMVYPDQKIKRLSQFLIILAGIFFLVISSAYTKLAWYDAPIMPFIAFFAALPVYFIYTHVEAIIDIPEKFYKLKTYAPSFVLILILAMPYLKILNYFEHTREQEENAVYYEASEYLKKAIKENNTDLDNSLLVYNAHTLAHIQFYINLLREKGIDITLTNYPDKLMGYSSVIVFNPSYQQFIRDHYLYRISERWGTLVHYELVKRKPVALPPLPELKEDYGYIRIYDTGI